MDYLREYTNLSVQLASLEMEFRLYGIDFSVKDNIHINIVPWYHYVSHPDTDLLDNKKVDYIIAEVVTSPLLHNLYNNCKGMDRDLFWFEVDECIKKDKVLDRYLMTPFVSLYDIINSLPTEPVVFGIARKTRSEKEREYSLVSKAFDYVKIIEKTVGNEETNVLILVGAYHSNNIYHFFKDYLKAKNVSINSAPLGKLEWFEPPKINNIKISNNKELLKSIIKSAEELTDILSQ